MIPDHELLYRRIPARTSFFSVHDGKLRLSNAAFSDAMRQPSVDRAALLQFFPARALTRPDQGVVCLIAGEVRAIYDITSDDQTARGAVAHDMDVIAAPSPHNRAHALIVAVPSLPSERPFLKLRERLARLAERRGWVLEPSTTHVC